MQTPRAHPSRHKTNSQLLKFSESLIFPCSASTETLRFDIYSPTGTSYEFTGTVKHRLNVLSDPKQIKDHAVAPAPAVSTPDLKQTPNPTPVESSVPLGVYTVAPSDSEADIQRKFLCLLALGPRTKAEILAVLHRTETQLAALFTAFSHTYSHHDTFTKHDVFPSLAGDSSPLHSATPQVLLKDKAYKDLRPWDWPFTTFERELVLKNTNNALSRLGFPDSHPLRRKIVEKPSPERVQPKRPATLGGGLLINKKQSVSPFPHSADTGSPRKRQLPDSPRSPFEPRKKTTEAHSGKSPARNVASLSLSALSSEDEKLQKQHPKGLRCYSNGSANSNTSMASMASMASVPSNYTLPLSTEEAHLADAIDLDKSSFLPPRPSSVVSSSEKKQQYYIQLAQKFKQKYQEYLELHQSLARETKRNSAQKRKSLTKLFELHQTLFEWKRKLWDFDSESNMAEEVMNLSKHRKSQLRAGSLAPPSVTMPSTERFPKHTHTDTSAKRAAAGGRSRIALDY